MDATTYRYISQIIQRPLKPMVGLLLIIAALVVPGNARAQVRSSTPQVLSRNQPSQNYTVLHVDAAQGSEQGTGEATKPYKTITQALRMAIPGTSTVILLAPGHYSQASGETFPLRLRPGITLQGNAGEARNTVIVGGSEVQGRRSAQSATVVTSDRSGLAHVAISNPKGNGVWIEAGAPIVRRVALVSNRGTGIYVSESAPIIENSYFNLNQQGLVIEGASRAIVRGNYFESTGRAISVSSPATPTINNNRIARNDVGIVLQNNARPTLEANVLNGNRRNGVVEVDPVALAPVTPTDSAPANVPAVRGPEVSRTTPEMPSGFREITATATPATIAAPESDAAVASSLVPVNTSATRLAPALAPVAITDGPRHPRISSGGEDNREFSASTPLAAHPVQSRVESARIEAVDTADEPMAAEPEGPPTRPIMTRSTPLALAVESQPNSQDVAINVDAALDEAMAGDAIPILVIPVDGAETISETPRVQGRGGETSKLLARLNARQSEPVAEVIRTEYADIDASDSSSQRLPVPAVAIPSGRGTERLPPPGTTSLARAFRYRILVDMDDANQLRSLVPDAFRTRVDSRTFMQAGAYVDEGEARERLEWLEDNGIDARMNVRN